MNKAIAYRNQWPSTPESEMKALEYLYLAAFHGHPGARKMAIHMHRTEAHGLLFDCKQVVDGRLPLNKWMECSYTYCKIIRYVAHHEFDQGHASVCLFSVKFRVALLHQAWIPPSTFICLMKQNDSKYILSNTVSNISLHPCHTWNLDWTR